MRFVVIDRCREDGCRCDDRAGVVLYDGESREDAEHAAETLARYPDPEIEERPARD